MANRQTLDAQAMLARNEYDAGRIRDWLSRSCNDWYYGTNLSQAQIAGILREHADWLDPTPDSPTYTLADGPSQGRPDLTGGG